MRTMAVFSNRHEKDDRVLHHRGGIHLESWCELRQ